MSLFSCDNAVSIFVGHVDQGRRSGHSAFPDVIERHHQGKPTRVSRAFTTDPIDQNVTAHEMSNEARTDSAGGCGRRRHTAQLRVVVRVGEACHHAVLDSSGIDRFAG